MVSVSINAQVKRDYFINENAGNLKLIYQRNVDLDKGDTIYMVMFLFQNAKYTSITDTKVIGLYDKPTLEQWMKDMKTAYKQMLTGEKVSIDWARDNYKLTLYDFTNNLYLTEPKGTGGYIPMTKKHVVDLMQSASRIDFGKDILLPAKTIEELIQ